MEERNENISAYEQVTRERLNHLTEEFRRHQKIQNGSLEKIYKSMNNLHEEIQSIKELFYQIQQDYDRKIDEKIQENFEHKNQVSKPEKILFSIMGAFVGGILVIVFTNVITRFI